MQQQLGRLSWVQESPRESPLQAGRTVAPEQACIVLRRAQGSKILPLWTLWWHLAGLCGAAILRAMHAVSLVEHTRGHMDVLHASQKVRAARSSFLVQI